jgi:phage major head subunit gpT-like protein
MGTATTNTDIAYGLAAVNTTWEEGATDFFSGGMVGPMIELLTETYQSETEYMAHAWLANDPAMSDWLGDRIVDMVRAYTFMTRMKPKQATLEFKRKEFAYDKLGVTLKKVQAFFQGARWNYDKHMHEKYASASGAGPTGYDGVALISASHPHGPAGATQSNSASTTVLSHSALVTYDAVMRLFRKENGESYGMTPSHLMVGANNAVKAKELLGIDRLLPFANTGIEAAAAVVGGVAKTNPFDGAMQLIVNQRETGYHWSILDLTKPGIRPFVMQENRFPEALSLDSMTDAPRWQRDVFQYSLEGDFEGDAGHWQSIIKSTASS